MSAENDALRTRLEALIDEWEAYDPGNPGGYAAELRAALAETSVTPPGGDVA